MTFYQGLDILTTVMAVSLSFCFVRLYIGPNVPNRTVAFDAIAIHAVGILALLSMREDAATLLDVALITAVLGFLGTTMMAYYLERSAHPHPPTDTKDPSAWVDPD